MGDMLQLAVVTPRCRVLTAQAESIILPGIEGAFGVLHNHAPLVAALGIGALKYGRRDGEKEIAAIGGGFVEVAGNTVTVLADSAELAGEIDVERAQASAERAEQRLRNLMAEVDFQRAEVALRKAMNRLQIARFGKNE